MAFDGASLNDYIDVAERIQAFYKQYPNGSLNQADLQFVNIGGKDYVVYTATAYRDPDDKLPGVGTAWEPIPGTTPYTKNSEVQNAETAAWGRAIVALGLASSARIASRQEVEGRNMERAVEQRIFTLKGDIAKALPGVAPGEIKRRLNLFLSLDEDFTGNYDADDLQRFLVSLGGATGEERAARAFGQEAPPA